MALFSRGDLSDRLRLFPSSAVRVSDGIRVQAVAKDDKKDRLICNRQRQNRLEHKLEGVSSMLPGA